MPERKRFFAVVTDKLCLYNTEKEFEDGYSAPHSMSLEGPIEMWIDPKYTEKVGLRGELPRSIQELRKNVAGSHLKANTRMQKPTTRVDPTPKKQGVQLSPTAPEVGSFQLVPDDALFDGLDYMFRWAITLLCIIVGADRRPELPPFLTKLTAGTFKKNAPLESLNYVSKRLGVLPISSFEVTMSMPRNSEKTQRLSPTGTARPTGALSIEANQMLGKFHAQIQCNLLVYSDLVKAGITVKDNLDKYIEKPNVQGQGTIDIQKGLIDALGGSLSEFMNKVPMLRTIMTSDQTVQRLQMHHMSLYNNLGMLFTINDDNNVDRSLIFRNVVDVLAEVKALLVEQKLAYTRLSLMTVLHGTERGERSLPEDVEKLSVANPLSDMTISPGFKTAPNSLISNNNDETIFNTESPKSISTLDRFRVQFKRSASSTMPVSTSASRTSRLTRLYNRPKSVSDTKARIVSNNIIIPDTDGFKLKRSVSANVMNSYGIQSEDFDGSVTTNTPCSTFEENVFIDEVRPTEMPMELIQSPELSPCIVRQVPSKSMDQFGIDIPTSTTRSGNTRTFSTRTTGNNSAMHWRNKIGFFHGSSQNGTSNTSLMSPTGSAGTDTDYSISSNENNNVQKKNGAGAGTDTGRVTSAEAVTNMETESERTVDPWKYGCPARKPGDCFCVYRLSIDNTGRPPSPPLLPIAGCKCATVTNDYEDDALREYFNLVMMDEDEPNASPILTSTQAPSILRPADSPTPIEINLNTSTVKTDMRWCKTSGSKKIVRGGTKESLLRYLTRHDDADDEYLNLFLMVYQSFTTPDKVLDFMWRRFHIETPEGLSTQERDHYMEHKVKRIRAQVVHVLERWITEYSNDLVEDFAFVARLVNFILGICRIVPKESHDLLQIFQIMMNSRIGNVYLMEPFRVTFAAPSEMTALANDLVFWKLEESLVAKQCAFIEWKLFRAIRSQELLNQNWNRAETRHKSPNVLKCIDQARNMTAWVVKCILLRDMCKERQKLLKWFIKLSWRCYQMNNFATTMALIAGFSNAAINRLRHTWDGISNSLKNKLVTMRMTLAPDNNSAKYRRTLQSIKGPRIPFLGVHLTDLTFIDDGNSDMLKDHPDYVNLEKLRKTYKVIVEIQGYQQEACADVKCDQKIIDILMSYVEPLDEEKDYQKSLKLEPRNSTYDEIK
eukprot:CFRG5879T1